MARVSDLHRKQAKSGAKYTRAKDKPSRRRKKGAFSKVAYPSLNKGSGGSRAKIHLVY